MGGKSFAGIGISGGGPNGSIHISKPCNSVEFNRWKMDSGKSSWEDDFGGAFKSLSTVANDLTM